MKGIYKGFKYISQIFVVKEREMEIGYPTDVKHVAHIGWEGQSGSAPSWMNEFKTTSEFAATSLGNMNEPRDPNSNAISTWSSQDFDQSTGHHQVSDMFKDSSTSDIPSVRKKNKRKKTKLNSSPKSSSPSSRSSRTSKSKAKYNEMETARTTSQRMV